MHAPKDYSYLDIPYIYKKRPILSILKRIFDIFVAILGILIAFLPMVIIGLIVLITSGRPIIYKHKRVGKNGKLFNVYKFKSMYNDSRKLEDILTKEEYEEFKLKHKIEDDPRITPFGKFLRKSSLDELPQLFNILKGDMSLIGPRPITLIELEEYNENKDFLLKVRPGLTGYWTAHGRSNIETDIRMKMELYYVAKRSILMDIKIFFKTIIVVITGKGAS